MRSAYRADGGVCVLIVCNVCTADKLPGTAKHSKTQPLHTQIETAITDRDSHAHPLQTETARHSKRQPCTAKDSQAQQKTAITDRDSQAQQKTAKHSHYK
ncbi:hypothetical protein BaRGS_00032933 [Batillaria attramentaria]|uniref:Secreted protein n=1 Tax=Batillaria attramentaria TaxID=370345 RepID=A0ABD0JMR9_9CAEN